MKFKKDLPEGGNAGNFFKLKDGESKLILCVGDPREYYAVWNGKGFVDTPMEQGGKFRFRINVVEKVGPAYVMKIWEGGKTVYDQLSGMHDEYGLAETLVKVSRKGSTKDDTVYTILPAKQQLDPASLNHIKTMKTLDLAAKPEQSGSAPLQGPPWPEEHEEIPF